MDEHKDCKETEDELWARIEKLEEENKRLKERIEIQSLVIEKLERQIHYARWNALSDADRANEIRRDLFK